MLAGISVRTNEPAAEVDTNGLVPKRSSLDPGLLASLSEWPAPEFKIVLRTLTVVRRTF